MRWQGQLGRPLNIACLFLSPDGKTLVGGRADGLVTFWDIAGMQEKSHYLLPPETKPTAFSPDGKALACIAAKDLVVTLRSVANGTLLHTMKPQRSDPSLGYPRLAFSPDGGTLAVTTGQFYACGVDLWDVHTGQLQRSLEKIPGYAGMTWGVHAVAFSPDGKTIAANSWVTQSTVEHIEGKDPASDTAPITGAVVGLWDVATGKWRRTFANASGPLAFSPDGKLLAATQASSIKTVQLFDLTTGERRQMVTVKGTEGLPVSLLDFLDGQHLLVNDGPVRVWDIASGSVEDIATMAILWIAPDSRQPTRSLVSALARSADGRHIATGYENGSIHLWGDDT